MTHHISVILDNSHEFHQRMFNMVFQGFKGGEYPRRNSSQLFFHVPLKNGKITKKIRRSDTQKPRCNENIIPLSHSPISYTPCHHPNPSIRRHMGWVSRHIV
jgi:hypothetical protein